MLEECGMWWNELKIIWEIQTLLHNDIIWNCIKKSILIDWHCKELFLYLMF